MTIVEGRKLANRVREGHRQFSTRIDLTEDDIRNRMPPLLTEIPAFDQGIGLARQRVYRQRPSILQDRDDWFARLHKGVNQTVLIAEQRERVPVSRPHRTGGFARDLLVVADDQKHHI